VYVALGSPKQDRLILALRNEFARTWWIGVGVSLSFMSGEIRRAPAWMQSVGLEWLHRLAQEPRRLAHRYLVEDLPFAARLLAASWRARRASSRAGPA
jgi:N-acetylglucosaminyldiphosphoundecaprenol N-acetyl-beta-D-mannosaminyltransferase